MKNFQIFRYLKKWMPVVVLFFVVMTAAAYYFLSNQQSYVAVAIIRYNNEEAIQGLAPDGTRINVSEIYSADVVTKAMKNLGISSSDFSVEELCASITAEPIVQADEEALKAALIEKGEQYTDEPTEYLVTCTLGSDVDEDFVRNLLNEVLDVYFSEYSDEHINNSQISNNIKGFKMENYDYLEAIEKISDDLSETIRDLSDYVNSDYNYRSVKTGYSFDDIMKQFVLLQDVNVNRIYSLILGNKITKDREILEARYLDRIAGYSLDVREAAEDLSDSERIIDTYVDKMRQSGNTNIDFNYILDQVYNERDPNDTTHKYADVDRTVEYDTLLENWVDARDDLDYAQIDRAYCAYILRIYMGEDYEIPVQDWETPSAVPTVEPSAAPAVTPSAEPDPAASEAVPVPESTDPAEENPTETPAPAPETTPSPAPEYNVEGITIVSRKATAEEVDAEIASLLERMAVLYQIADETGAEYNDYLGALNIQTLSSVSATATINLKLYLVIIAVVFLVLGCSAAIVAGRIGDILEYTFLRDRQTGCMNRVSCDNYIREMSSKVLPGGFRVINLQLQKQAELNAELGREKADKILSRIGDVLHDIFGTRKGSFIGYNGSGQFWAFYDDATAEGESELNRLNAVLRDEFHEYPVCYALGTAGAEEMDDYHIRSLISKSVQSRVPHVTNAVQTADAAPAD